MYPLKTENRDKYKEKGLLESFWMTLEKLSKFMKRLSISIKGES